MWEGAREWACEGLSEEGGEGKRGREGPNEGERFQGLNGRAEGGREGVELREGQRKWSIQRKGVEFFFWGGVG